MKDYNNDKKRNKIYIINIIMHNSFYCCICNKNYKNNFKTFHIRSLEHQNNREYYYKYIRNQLDENHIIIF